MAAAYIVFLEALILQGKKISTPKVSERNNRVYTHALYIHALEAKYRKFLPFGMAVKNVEAECFDAWRTLYE